MEYAYITAIATLFATVIGAYLNKYLADKSGKQKYIVFADKTEADGILPKLDERQLSDETKDKLEEIILAQIHKIEIEDRRYHYRFLIKGKRNECTKLWGNIQENPILKNIVGISTFTSVGSWLPFTRSTYSISIYCSRIITPTLIHDLVLGFNVELINLGLMLYSEKN